MNNPSDKKIICKLTLASPRGFCAGVERAIGIVEKALEIFGSPIYMRHEVVHNKFVVDRLKSKGVIFVQELHEVPDHSVVILSAHGVAKSVKDEATIRQLKVFDATCPLVTKVHLDVIRSAKMGADCILIGHKGHPEVEGTLGQFDQSFGGNIYLVQTINELNTLEIKNPDHLCFVTQTTLSVDETKELTQALKAKYPNISSPRGEDICYATQNRQNAVKLLSENNSLILVVGSKNSSNSNRLKELAEQQGKKAYLIDSYKEIDLKWLEGHLNVGITAGASAPEVLVKEIIDYLVELGAVLETNPNEVKESIIFPLPKELRTSRK